MNVVAYLQYLFPLILDSFPLNHDYGWKSLRWGTATCSICLFRSSPWQTSPGCSPISHQRLQGMRRDRKVPQRWKNGANMKWHGNLHTHTHTLEAIWYRTKVLIYYYIFFHFGNSFKLYTRKTWQWKKTTIWVDVSLTKDGDFPLSY